MILRFIMSQVLLVEPELSYYKEKFEKERFEGKDFLPLFGFYNYMKRSMGAKNLKEFLLTLKDDLADRIKFTRSNPSYPLKQIIHLGLADWPRNPKLRGSLSKKVLRNITMSLYHSAWYPALDLSIYYSAIKCFEHYYKL